MKTILLTLCSLATLATLAAPCVAQSQKGWTLEQCIEQARQNNIAVQQRAIAAQDAEVQLSTARNSRLPDLNATLGSNIYFGRGPSRDGTYKDNTQLSGTLGVSTSIPIFQGMLINKQIKGSKLNLEAAMQDMERAKEDVAVNVMTLYLQVLFNKELVTVAEQKLALSTQQVQLNAALVDEGRQPISARYESEALQTNDELALVQARNELTLALLNLSQALNRPSAEGFDVQMPLLDSLSIAALHQLGDPDRVYDYADAHRPMIAAERTRLASSENALKIARAALY
ncbi:MAG: TolC family protein, partial [Alistipes sp.]